MKSFLFISFAFLCLSASAQISPTGLNWQLCVAPPATAIADSIKLTANFTTSAGYSSLLWTYGSGSPSYSIGTPVLTSINGVTQSTVTIRKLQPGNYTFLVTGISKDSLKGTVTIPVFVPTPPSPVAQRVAVGVQWNVFGTWIAVPAGYFKIAYSDGSTQ